MSITGEQLGASADDLAVAIEFYGGSMNCSFLDLVENIDKMVNTNRA